MNGKYGADRFRQVLFDKLVQQRLSRSCYKKLTNSNGDKSLVGLVIDWHLANTEMGFDNFVEPILDYQPTYDLSPFEFVSFL
jgi:hypothetical protein